MDNQNIFEADLTDVYRYKFSYGGQSPYFHGRARGRLVASCCQSCHFTWLPMREICSRCYGETKKLELSNEGEILTSLVLPSAPIHLEQFGFPVASALVRIDGADTCIKTLVVSRTGNFAKGTRVKAEFGPKISTIGDFWFVTIV